VQFGCAFDCHMRFRCHFYIFDTENEIENACDSETHIQTAHSKRKCNRPLKHCLVPSMYACKELGLICTLRTYVAPSSHIGTTDINSLFQLAKKLDFFTVSPELYGEYERFMFYIFKFTAPLYSPFLFPRKFNCSDQF
jgi:hypothetical protein